MNITEDLAHDLATDQDLAEQVRTKLEYARDYGRRHDYDALTDDGRKLLTFINRLWPKPATRQQALRTGLRQLAARERDARRQQQVHERLAARRRQRDPLGWGAFFREAS